LADEAEVVDEDEYFVADMLPPIIHMNCQWSCWRILK